MNPLAKKLQIKPNSRWLLYNAPAHYADDLTPLPADVEIDFNINGHYNGVQLFIINSAQLEADLQIIVPLLKDDTILWIIYPKKKSGIVTDLEMTGSWDAPTRYGLRPVASAAINETWTALRFRPVEQVKVSEGRAEAVKSNEYGAFIDVVNRTVTLPDYIKAELEQHTGALAWFEQLAYSNKKEYVLWVLTAKQEKTRQDRLAKMVEMLINKKKNPADK